MRTDSNSNKKFEIVLTKWHFKYVARAIIMINKFLLISINKRNIHLSFTILNLDDIIIQNLKTYEYNLHV